MADWSIRHNIASARHLVDAAVRYGAKVDDCVAHTGISAAVLAQPDAEITAEQELRLIRNVVRLLPAASELPLEVGAQYQLTDFGIWGYALISSRTLRDAVELAVRYLDLSYIFGHLVLERTGDAPRLRFDYRAIPADIRPFLLQRDIVAIGAIQNQVSPGARAVRRVQLGFPRPAHARRLEALLAGIRPEYEAQETLVVLDAAVLDQPLPQANAATQRMCEEECRKLLARRKTRTGVSARVRDLLTQRPGDVPDMDAVAQRLCVTARTLRRQLAGEGITFRALRDEVLMVLAEELLGTASMKMHEVAERLGYSDASAFTHAFKRWKGVPPREARR